MKIKKIIAALLLASAMVASAATHKPPTITSKTAVVKVKHGDQIAYVIRKHSGDWKAFDTEGNPLTLSAIGVVDDPTGVLIELLHAETSVQARNILVKHATSDYSYQPVN